MRSVSDCASLDRHAPPSRRIPGRATRSWVDVPSPTVSVIVGSVAEPSPAHHSSRQDESRAAAIPWARMAACMSDGRPDSRCSRESTAPQGLRVSAGPETKKGATARKAGRPFRLQGPGMRPTGRYLVGSYVRRSTGVNSVARPDRGFPRRGDQSRGNRGPVPEPDYVCSADRRDRDGYSRGPVCSNPTQPAPLERVRRRSLLLRRRRPSPRIVVAPSGQTDKFHVDDGPPTWPVGASRRAACGSNTRGS